MLEKQYINWYVWNRGGSAETRTGKAAETGSTPEVIFSLGLRRSRGTVTSQLSLLFLGCALAPYPWTISCTVSVITSRFSILAATVSHNCSYRIPNSPPYSHPCPHQILFPQRYHLRSFVPIP
ncbi:hypothetical protein BDM02DRAFT_1283026 [Thelephora ganbajun]|uniref:Uncharacterized protein n=1 Tax=Thelephora ganbajun TaxID=370292 RepID=A0ACB6Z2T7_THEGA|nr:hypothetical protein BDM02DRAFT_1283026 [Thelephora ganbajun]